jgi:CBS domain-containing protein
LSRKGHEVCSVPDAPVRDVLSLMASKGVAGVLVISEGKLVGILSAKDYGQRVVLEGKPSGNVRVQVIMSNPVITVNPDADAAQCLAIMTHHRIRHLPVLDQGKLTGIVSTGDLASAIIRPGVRNRSVKEVHRPSISLSDGFAGGD